MFRKISLRRFSIRNVNVEFGSSNKPKFLPITCCNQHVRSVETGNKSKNDLNLRDFIKASIKTQTTEETPEEIPYLNSSLLQGNGQRVFFEVYGCQMNVNDAEVAWAILQGAGYQKTSDVHDADVVLLITCAIREGAEQKIWARINELTKLKKSRMLTEAKLRPKIGILGCMAERLKEKVLEKDRSVDMIAGPDSYKDLPRLLALTRSYRKAINVILSLDETYADVMPVRLDEDSVSSYVSIMRGCNNMCTYCIVPFTRGRERSRPVDSIVDEIKILSEQGIKEVTLLGQNVNSYRDTSQSTNNGNKEEIQLAKGFKTVYKLPKGGIPFAQLLDRVSDVDPEMRVRFTSPHPKDFPDEVLEVIRNKPNICKTIHLPAQSGNNEVLERMRRGYTREAYLELVNRIREYLPRVTFSSDFILGFCGETEEQYRDTVSLIEIVRFNTAFVFAYSLRQKTAAHRRYEDDIPREVKLQRVAEVFTVYRSIAEELNKDQIGEYQLILVEGDSRRSDQELAGRNDGNLKVIIPKCNIPANCSSSFTKEIKPGDYVCVKINDATSQVLKGTPLHHTTLQDFYKSNDISGCNNQLQSETMRS